MMADLTEKSEVVDYLLPLEGILAFLLRPNLEAALVEVLNTACAVAGR